MRRHRSTRKPARCNRAAVRVAALGTLALCAACSDRGARDAARAAHDAPPPASADSAESADAPDTTVTVGGFGASVAVMSDETPAYLSPAGLDSIPTPTIPAQEWATLAPPALLLRDLGFQIPHVAPDTTGKKNKARLQREWVEALQDYEAGNYTRAQEHLRRAREFYAGVTEPDKHWPERMRNLEAAILYATKPPGETVRTFGEIVEPRGEYVLDGGYLWVAAHDDLRLGRGREAVARLRLIQRSPLKVNLEARKLLAQLFPDSLGVFSSSP